MNTVSLNNLWSYLQGLSLSASNKQWLGDKLIESSRTSRLTEKEKKLEALTGVWADEDGERIANAIKDSRKNEYTRRVETID